MGANGSEVRHTTYPPTRDKYFPSFFFLFPLFFFLFWSSQFRGKTSALLFTHLVSLGRFKSVHGAGGVDVAQRGTRLRPCVWIRASVCESTTYIYICICIYDSLAHVIDIRYIALAFERVRCEVMHSYLHTSLTMAQLEKYSQVQAFIILMLYAFEAMTTTTETLIFYFVFLMIKLQVCSFTQYQLSFTCLRGVAMRIMPWYASVNTRNAHHALVCKCASCSRMQARTHVMRIMPWYANAHHALVCKCALCLGMQMRIMPWYTNAHHALVYKC